MLCSDNFEALQTFAAVMDAVIKNNVPLENFQLYSPTPIETNIQLQAPDGTEYTHNIIIGGTGPRGDADAEGNDDGLDFDVTFHKNKKPRRKRPRQRKHPSHLHPTDLTAPELTKQDAISTLPPRYRPPSTDLSEPEPVSVEWFAMIAVQLMADGVDSEPLLRVLAEFEKMDTATGMTPDGAVRVRQQMTELGPILELLHSESVMQHSLIDASVRMDELIMSCPTQGTLDDTIMEMGDSLVGPLSLTSGQIAQLKYMQPFPEAIDGSVKKSQQSDGDSGLEFEVTFHTNKSTDDRLKLMEACLTCLDQVVHGDNQLSVLKDDLFLSGLEPLSPADSLVALDRLVSDAPEFHQVLGDAMCIAQALMAIEGRLMGAFEADEVNPILPIIL